MGPSGNEDEEEALEQRQLVEEESAAPPQQLEGEAPPCSLEEMPSFAERQAEFFQCDRECRWRAGGSLSRKILGQRRAWLGSSFHAWGRACCCFQRTVAGGVKLLNQGQLIPRTSVKQPDTARCWSGTGAFSRDPEAVMGFDSPWLCAQLPNGELRSILRASTTGAEEHELLHCGQCAACSSPEDIAILARTRRWMAGVMASVAQKFAAPWGHGDVGRLEAELRGADFGFSSSSSSGRRGGAGAEEDEPSCMQCWLDNVMCASVNCYHRCWMVFFRFAATSDCLACDEAYCGPEFIKCAGANRRSVGLTSDIRRSERMICKEGVYYGKAEEELPTQPPPAAAELRELLSQGRAALAEREGGQALPAGSAAPVRV